MTDSGETPDPSGLPLDELTKWVNSQWGNLRPGAVPDNATLAAQSLAASPLSGMEWPAQSAAFSELVCDNCGSSECSACGQHFCAEECGACGGGCRCYCFCPTMRDD